MPLKYVVFLDWKVMDTCIWLYGVWFVYIIYISAYFPGQCSVCWGSHLCPWLSYTCTAISTPRFISLDCYGSVKAMTTFADGYDVTDVMWCDIMWSSCLAPSSPVLVLSGCGKGAQGHCMPMREMGASQLLECGSSVATSQGYPVYGEWEYQSRADRPLKEN